MSDVTVALVLVSHSSKLAQGLVEVATQMAPDVPMFAVGGTDDGRVGTSFNKVEQAIKTALNQGYKPVVLSDIGSAGMLVDAVAETLEVPLDHVLAPFVEGAVAAAVIAQTGGEAARVVEAAHEATAEFGAPPEAMEQTSADAISEHVRINNKLGLHARPAAMVARIVSEYEAHVTVNGVDAASVLALMGLALPGGAEVQLQASGADAPEVLKALVPQFEEGFGEE